MSSLKPVDLVVVLNAHLWSGPCSFERLGSAMGVSASQAHAALRRLAAAGLYREGDRSLRVHAFTLFAAHGVSCVFPAQVGESAVGMPTAHAAPPFRDELVYAEAYVWPCGEGVAGRAVVPLHPGVPRAARQDARLYAALALLDALRVGRVRERRLAEAKLERLLGHVAGEDARAQAPMSG